MPTFDSARDKVLHAYKMKKSRELALQQAEAYAKDARAAQKPLAEVFQGREGLEVTDTGPFTHLTMGNTPFDPESSEPRLSPVHGVEAAGQEFMNAVFGASPGEVKVALNQPQTVAYVVQLEKFMPDRGTLEHEFIMEPFQKYARAAGEDHQNLELTWITTVEREAGVDWVEPPRSDTRGEE